MFSIYFYKINSHFKPNLNKPQTKKKKKQTWKESHHAITAIHFGHDLYVLCNAFQLICCLCNMWCHNQQSLPSPSPLHTLPYHFLTLEKTKLNDIVLSCVRFLFFFSFYQTNTCQNWRSQDTDHDDVYCGIAKAILFFLFLVFLYL